MCILLLLASSTTLLSGIENSRHEWISHHRVCISVQGSSQWVWWLLDNYAEMDICVLWEVLMVDSLFLFLFCSEDILNEIKKASDIIGSPGKFWLGPRLCININKPEQIEKVLNDPGCLDKGNLYDFVADGLGHGLVTLRGMWSVSQLNCDDLDEYSYWIRSFSIYFRFFIIVPTKGEVWRTHRKNINPCFSSSIINSYFPIMNKALRMYVDCTNQKISEGNVNVREALGALSLDLICGKQRRKNYD